MKDFQNKLQKFFITVCEKITPEKLSDYKLLLPRIFPTNYLQNFSNYNQHFIFFTCTMHFFLPMYSFVN